MSGACGRKPEYLEQPTQPANPTQNSLGQNHKVYFVIIHFNDSFHKLHHLKIFHKSNLKRLHKVPSLESRHWVLGQSFMLMISSSIAAARGGRQLGGAAEVVQA